MFKTYPLTYTACPDCGSRLDVTAEGSEKSCVTCDDANYTSVPTAEDLAGYLSILLDPETSDADRETALGEFHDRLSCAGRADVKSFQRAGVLTDNDGLVLRAGNLEFQITIVEG